MGNHALLSASGAERWMTCPPSARLQEEFKSTTSIYAKEGTLAHEVADLVNKFNFKKISKTKFNKEITQLEKYDLYSDEMLNHANDFMINIKETVHSVTTDDIKPAIFFEEKIDFLDYVPDGFGTVDCIIIADKSIEVIDYKYGKGVLVSAEENKQMMLYALGAYSLYSPIYDGIETIKMTIFQPRLDSVSSFTMTIFDLLNWAETELKEKAKLAFEGAGDFNPGDHCMWCRAKAVCRKRAETHLALSKYEYTHPNLLTPDEISSILIISEHFKNWVDDTSKYALDEMLDGKVFKGFKLVEGRANRKYLDEAKVLDVLIKAGFKDEDVITKKLLGLTAMEKTLTKKVFDDVIGNYIIKPQGAPTLAKETDKRPIFNSAVEDFKHVNVV